MPPPGPDGPLIGELFAGYGGLGKGVQMVLGGTVTWVSDVCKFDKDGNAGHYSPHRGPCAILARRFPDVPNLGDVTKIDWREVPRVHVLTGGSPCQDLSHAGRRAGMTEGTRSNLWVAMREAIHVLRPSVVVWENVRGALTAEADSELVTDPRLLADLRRRDGEPVLRAAGRVVGDLSELGYDCRWHSVRASDVGATHGRFRVFIVATDSACDPWWELDGDGRPAADAGGQAGLERAGLREGDQGGDGGGLAARGGGPDEAVELLGTPTARMWKGSGQPGSASHTWLLDHGNVEAQVLSLPEPGPLLPTPAVNDMGASYTPEEWDAWTDRMKAEHGNGNGHGNSLSVEAQRLLPTPQAHDAKGAKTPEQVAAMRADGHGVANLNEVAAHELAGEGRLLPTPTTTDALGARNSTCWRDPERRDGHPGDTLLDVMWKVAGVEDPKTTAERKVTSDPAERTPDARASDHRPAAPLFDLRDAPGQEAVREAAGGPDAVPVPQDLRAELREQPPRGDEERAPRPSEEAPGEGVSGLRDDRGSACPPRGPGHDERRPVEPDDAVRELSPEAALAGGPGEAAAGPAWGDYEPVIRRWERILGRPAPEPTQPSKKGNPQLAADFVEFMMGLPAGWVTDVPISRNDQLKALGNGVVPQQAAYAVAHMLTWRLPS